MSMSPALARLLQVEGSDDPLKQDFRNMLFFIWTEVLDLCEPAPIQYDMAHRLQNMPVAEDGISRGQLQALRGAGKTWIVAAFCVWLLYCNPNIKVALVGSTGPLAKRLLLFVRSLLNHPLLEHLAPKDARDNPFGRKDQLDTEIKFDCGAATKRSSEPAVHCFSMKSTFTGFHPDIILADDVEVPENSLTEQARERLHEKCKEFESLINPLGFVLFLGTPQTEESLYTTKLDERYEIMRWPAEFPDPENPIMVENIAPSLLALLASGEARPGDPTYPERFDTEALMVKRAIEGVSMYALQYLLDPTLADSDRYPLKLVNLVVYDMDHELGPSSCIWGTSNPCRYIESPGLSHDSFHNAVRVSEDFLPYTRRIMWVDPAGGGADSVAYGVFYALNGFIYCPKIGELAAGKGQDGTSDAVMKKLAKIAFTYGVKQVFVEKNFGDGMYAKLLHPHLLKTCGPVACEVINNSGQKERRIIDTLGPLMDNHRLVISEQAAKCTKAWYQVSHITRDKGCLRHDDLADTLASGCALLADLVTVNPEAEDEKRRMAEKETMAADFVKSFKANARQGRSIAAGQMIAEEERDRFLSGRQPRGTTRRGRQFL